LDIPNADHETTSLFSHPALSCVGPLAVRLHNTETTVSIPITISGSGNPSDECSFNRKGEFLGSC
jgi:hypothetical protein